MTDAQIQCYNNVGYGLHYFGLDEYVGSIGRVEQDRVIFQCCPGLETSLDECGDFSRWWYCRNHGKDAYASWRENVGSCSMQISMHRHDDGLSAEVDYDYGRPGWDVVSWCVHAWECLRNRVTGGKTDPYKVREMLNQRGFGVPLVERKP